MGHKKESRDNDERRKHRRRSNSPSAKRARKNSSRSDSISVKSKTYRKRRYYQSMAESLSQSSLESSSESLQQCPSPQKNTEVAVNDILQVLNKEAITKVKVILLLAKNKHEKKKPKQIEE